MTTIYKGCGRCRGCKWFYPIVPKLIGSCEWPKSDHYGHCITPEHPICKEYEEIL